MSRSDQAPRLTYSELLLLVEDVIVGENSVLQTGYTRMENLQIQDVKESNPTLLGEMLDGDGSKLKYIGRVATHMQTSGESESIIWEHRWARFGKPAKPNKPREPQSMIRIVEYPQASQMDKMCNPVINNAVVRTILSDFRINRILDTIACPICNLDADGSDLREYEEIASKINPDRKYLVQATELWHEMITLDAFLNKYELNLVVWKNIIAKLINTIAVISRQYPDYRHGYLVPEYIDCYVTNQKGTDHAMPKLGMHYRSSMAQIGGKPAMTPDLARTSYTDVWKLLSYLWNHYRKSIEKYPGLVEIFQQLYPESIRSEDPYLTQAQWDTLSDAVKTKLHPSHIMTAAIFQSDDQVQGNTRGFQENQLSRNGRAETEFQRINRISEQMARNGHRESNKIRRVVIADAGSSKMSKKSTKHASGTKYMSRMARADAQRSRGSDVPEPIPVLSGKRNLMEPPATFSRVSSHTGADRAPNMSRSGEYDELIAQLTNSNSGSSKSEKQTVGSRFAQTMGMPDEMDQYQGPGGMNVDLGNHELHRPMPQYAPQGQGYPNMQQQYGMPAPQGMAYPGALGMQPPMPSYAAQGMSPYGMPQQEMMDSQGHQYYPQQQQVAYPGMQPDAGYPGQMQQPMGAPSSMEQDQMMQRYLAAGQIGGAHPSTYNQQKQGAFFRQPPVTGQGRK